MVVNDVDDRINPQVAITLYPKNVIAILQVEVRCMIGQGRMYLADQSIGNLLTAHIGLEYFYH